MTQNNPQILNNSFIANFKYKGFRPQNCDFNLALYEKIQYRHIKGWYYINQINSQLAKTHVLTDISLGNLNQHKSSPVISADLDPVEHKYILVGKSSGGLAVYNSSNNLNKSSFPQVAIKRGGSRGTHKNGVTCIQWYPIDAGLFTTSSSDSLVKIWDPNTMQNVDDFPLGCKIYHHHMSPVASKHSILAAAGETGEVILCDLRTGSSTHRMHGHEGPVQVVQWTRHNQTCLVSGGKDKTIRFWDVRSGKACFQILGEKNEERVGGKCPSVAHTSPIVSLCFTYDGLWLISFSSDGNMKLWNTFTGENKDVRFGPILGCFRRNFNMAVTRNLYPDLVYVPIKSKIFVYEIVSGALVNIMNGHFDTVLGTMFNPETGDVYSYGTDRNFLVWRPDRFLPKDIEGNDSREQEKNIITKDSWSSDED